MKHTGGVSIIFPASFSMVKKKKVSYSLLIIIILFVENYIHEAYKKISNSVKIHASKEMCLCASEIFHI